MNESAGDGDPLVLGLGPEQLVVRRRYEVASIINDFMIGAWFLVGSWLFFHPEWERTGIWLFVMGSAQFLVRPVIRLSRRIHIQRATSEHWDF